MITRLFLFYVLLLIPRVQSGKGIKLTFQVEPKAEECVYEEMSATQEFKMNYEVTRGGLLDIKLRITDPNDQIIQEKMSFFNRQDENEGRVLFVSAIPGTHKICFDNTMSRWTAKVVSFHVKTGQDVEKKPGLA